MELKFGRYRHYKGMECKVIGVAKHSETLEKMVVYEESDDGQLWVRSLKMFLEEVEKDGRRVPRFEYLGER